MLVFGIDFALKMRYWLEHGKELSMKKNMPNTNKLSLKGSHILPAINKELRAFLRHSLVSESFWQKWTAIDFGFERIKCWEVKGCKKNAVLPSWMLTADAGHVNGVAIRLASSGFQLYDR